MPGYSNKTVTVSFRVPVEIYTKLVKRANRKRLGVNEYIKDKILYDVNRKH
uniref:Uncharacterized protein n=1 Tax=viral metagenome TaxID=1070528 RepID=A0A6M3JLI8_9ZZZZ